MICLLLTSTIPIMYHNHLTSTLPRFASCSCPWRPQYPEVFLSALAHRRCNFCHRDPHGRHRPGTVSTVSCRCCSKPPRDVSRPSHPRSGPIPPRDGAQLSAMLCLQPRRLTGSGFARYRAVYWSRRSKPQLIQHLLLGSFHCRVDCLSQVTGSEESSHRLSDPSFEHGRLASIVWDASFERRLPTYSSSNGESPRHLAHYGEHAVLTFTRS